MLPPVVAAALLIVAFTRWFQWRPSYLEPSANSVYAIHNGVWRPLPPLPGQPEKLQVSAGGTVWALLWHYGAGSELARLDGSAWRTFTAADFGTGSSPAAAGFALDGETVWLPTDEGVLSWDGRAWKCSKEIVASTDSSAIAAAAGQVWVLDEKGAIAHFDGRQWAAHRIALPPEKPGSDRDDSAELAATGDGTLWLVRDGVWRWDGSAWAAVKPGGAEFEEGGLVGATGKRIWLWNGFTLGAVGPDGAPQEFAREALGVTLGEQLRDVVETGGRIEVATTRGILEFDGAAWRRLPPPGNGVQSVVGIQYGAGGDLLAIGNTPHAVARRLQILIRLVPLLLMLALLGVVVWMVRIHKRRQLDDHQRLQEAVAHATGAVPEEFARDARLLAKQSSWWSAFVTVGVIGGAMMAYSLTRLFWPGVPPWMFLAIALALHVVVMLAQTLVRHTPKPWDPIEPGGASFDWGPTRRALPASLGVFVLMNLGHLPTWVGDPLLWLLYGILAVVWFEVLEVRFLNAALRRGDYEGGLRIVRRFYFWNPDGAAALRRRGHMLLSGGRFREAEEALRRAVARLRSHNAEAHALEFLGDALLEQGRYEEAMRSYEAALRAAPGYRRPYRGMAEVALRQGRDPARALEYVENILTPAGARSSLWTQNGRPHDDYWSLKAWALAELGRGSEVAPAIAEAIRKTNFKSRPDAAATYRRLGLAMQALDRQAEADEYLKKAVEADPNGRWSALARAALQRGSLRAQAR